MKKLILLTFGIVIISNISKAQSGYFDEYRKNPFSRTLCTTGSCSFSDLSFIESYYGDRVDIEVLEESLDKLKDHFNKYQGKSRFISLLSPECPRCIEGAIAIREGILDKYPDKDLSVTIVWVDMYSGDDYSSARRTARILDDPRVKHFYDFDDIVGPAFAKSMGASHWESLREPAWDIYMFYSGDTSWETDLPVPDDYTHQLNRGYGHWAERRYFNSGVDLYHALIDISADY